MLHRWFCALLVIAASQPVWGEDAAPGTRTKRVLVIGIDGCRTDAIDAAQTPNLDKLIKEGGFARNTEILGDRKTGSDTVSGPSWSSICTGVWADKHGVRNNSFRGANYKEFPHFFSLLKEKRPDAYTASFVTWGPIHDLIVADADLTRDTRGGKSYAKGDELVAEEASELLTTKDPDALFVYFGNVDETGHWRGFHPKVSAYIKALEVVDGHIGTVLKALRARPKFAEEDWLILVCTDHGGRGIGHGGGHDAPEVRTVFLIVSGPSAVSGKIEQPTFLVDVPATALTHLGIEIDPDWKLDGKPVGLKPAVTP